DYTHRMPFPRPLNEHERRMIAALQTLTEADAPGAFTGDMTPGERKRLEKIQFEVRPPAEVSGAQVVRLLRAVPPGAGPVRLLEKAALHVDVNGETVPIPGDLVVALVRQAAESVPAKLKDSEVGRTLRDLKELNPDAPAVRKLEKAKLRLDFGDQPLKID